MPAKKPNIIQKLETNNKVVEKTDGKTAIMPIKTPRKMK